MGRRPQSWVAAPSLRLGCGKPISNRLWLDRLMRVETRRPSPMDSLRAVRQFEQMNDSWTNIQKRFRKLREGESTGGWAEALGGVEQLAEHIGAGPVGGSLFGWTSMHDLCIQQTNMTPHSGPFLRVRPLTTGMVEFRYHDTAVADRQWSRQVPATGVIARFEAFLGQLGWVRGISA